MSDLAFDSAAVQQLDDEATAAKVAMQAKISAYQQLRDNPMPRPTRDHYVDSAAYFKDLDTAWRECIDAKLHYLLCMSSLLAMTCGNLAKAIARMHTVP